MLNTNRHKCMDKTNTTILMQSFAFGFTNPANWGRKQKTLSNDNVTEGKKNKEERKSKRQTESEIDDQKEWQWGPKKR